MIADNASTFEKPVEESVRIKLASNDYPVEQSLELLREIAPNYMAVSKT